MLRLRKVYFVMEQSSKEVPLLERVASLAMDVSSERCVNSSYKNTRLASNRRLFAYNLLSCVYLKCDTMCLRHVRYLSVSAMMKKGDENISHWHAFACHYLLNLRHFLFHSKDVTLPDFTRLTLSNKIDEDDDFSDDFSSDDDDFSDDFKEEEEEVVSLLFLFVNATALAYNSYFCSLRPLKKMKPTQHQ